MLEQLDKAKHKWGGLHSLIDRWLDDRQQLLVNFCGMFKQDEAHNKQTLPDEEKLTNFCQQLVDYISLGHFEVYESLVVDSDMETEPNLKLAQKLYPEISNTTDEALAFNDKYSNTKYVDEYDVLAKDLSNIGEAIATRIELEDQLIEAFHKSISSIVSPS